MNLYDLKCKNFLYAPKNYMKNSKKERKIEKCNQKYA